MTSNATNAQIRCNHGSDHKCVNCDDRITQYETAKFMHSSADGFMFNEADLQLEYAKAALLPAHRYKLYKWLMYITLLFLFLSACVVWWMVAVGTVSFWLGLLVQGGLALICLEVIRTHRNC